MGLQDPESGRSWKKFVSTCIKPSEIFGQKCFEGIEGEMSLSFLSLMPSNHLSTAPTKCPPEITTVPAKTELLTGTAAIEEDHF